MGAHVLLNSLNELMKEIKCDACQAFYMRRTRLNSVNNIFYLINMHILCN